MKFLRKIEGNKTLNWKNDTCENSPNGDDYYDGKIEPSDQGNEFRGCRHLIRNHEHQDRHRQKRCDSQIDLLSSIVVSGSGSEESSDGDDCDDGSRDDEIDDVVQWLSLDDKRRLENHPRLSTTGVFVLKRSILPMTEGTNLMTEDLERFHFPFLIWNKRSHVHFRIRVIVQRWLGIRPTRNSQSTILTIIREKSENKGKKWKSLTECSDDMWLCRWPDRENWDEIRFLLSKIAIPPGCSCSVPFHPCSFSH